MAVVMTERQKLQGRLDAAKINGGTAAVTPRGNDRYTVEGRAGARYTVQGFGLETWPAAAEPGSTATRAGTPRRPIFASSPIGWWRHEHRGSMDGSAWRWIASCSRSSRMCQLRRWKRSR